MPSFGRRPPPQEYSGECSNCKTHWDVTMEAPADTEYPEEIVIECPVPFCGLVTLHKEAE